MTTLEVVDVANEIAELRTEMNDGFKRIDEKLDSMLVRTMTEEKRTELRIQALEIAESRRPAPPQQPCKYLIEHTDWHAKQEAETRRCEERTQSRIWSLLIRLAPIIAALLAGAFGVQYI